MAYSLRQSFSKPYTPIFYNASEDYVVPPPNNSADGAE